jgi:ABC-type multidrug transport system fused ATPase/permease subunit
MTASTPNPYDPMDDILAASLKLCYVAIGTFVAKFLDTLLWIRIGSFLSRRLKDKLFSNMMRSDIAFFDVKAIGSLLTILSENSQQVEEGFGRMKGDQISNHAQFLFDIIMAFSYEWRMALISRCAVTFLSIVMGSMASVFLKQSGLQFKFTTASMTVAEETLGSIRTVKANNGEDVEAKRFLQDSEGAVKAKLVIGWCITGFTATVQVGMWGFAALNLWYGARLVEDGKLLAGDVFSVFGFTMMGVVGIILVQGTVQAEQKALAAGARILKLAQYVPDVPFDGGAIIDDFKGRIVIQNCRSNARRGTSTS